jgi:hypothetical protein
MEWWNNGILGMKTDNILIFVFDKRHLYIKVDLFPPTPVFQHSIIPLFQYSMALDYCKVCDLWPG